MNDIYEYLKVDHEKVNQLFDLYETTLSEKNKLDIVAMLHQELIVHAAAEEATFYKILEQYRESKKEVFHGEEEHQEIRDKLDEITQIQQANKELDHKVQELKKLVKHHVSEEEGNIFAEAKKVLTKEEAYMLKDKMHSFKEKLLLADFSE